MNIIWTRRAIGHLATLRSQLEKDAAATVARRILEATEVLKEHPEIGRPGKALGTRELMIPDTHYFIPYRVRRGRPELIAVLREG